MEILVNAGRGMEYYSFVKKDMSDIFDVDIVDFPEGYLSENDSEDYSDGESKKMLDDKYKIDSNI